MKIICVGRNYAKHAAELNNAVPSEPVLFLKPDSALLPKGQAFFIPDFSKDLHYEAELVLRINRVGKHIEPAFARRYFDQITVGIDFTARDLQESLKQKGLPWEKAKAFDGSTFLGDWRSVAQLGPLDDLHFSLHKNASIAQKGHSADLLFGFDQLIAEISKYFTLKIGDLIFTGTPAGVGPVAPGDELRLFLGDEDLGALRVK